jgi:hypothetical protein
VEEVVLTVSAVALHQRKDFFLRKRLAVVVKLQDFIGSKHKTEGPAYLIVFDLEFLRNISRDWWGEAIRKTKFNISRRLNVHTDDSTAR